MRTYCKSNHKWHHPTHRAEKGGSSKAADFSIWLLKHKWGKKSGGEKIWKLEQYYLFSSIHQLSAVDGKQEKLESLVVDVFTVKLTFHIFVKNPPRVDYDLSKFMFVIKTKVLTQFLQTYFVDSG